MAASGRRGPGNPPREFDAEHGTCPERSDWPVGDAHPFRRFERSALIGRGAEVWERASHDVLRWVVKTRSGFAVTEAGPVVAGVRLEITARVGGVTIREPVQIVAVVHALGRVGFSYRTLPGHPVRGEEAFIAYREGEDVYLTVRSLTAAAAEQPWRFLYPLLRIGQVIARHRYLRALR